MQTENIKVNELYLVGLVGIVTLTASGFGIALVATGQLADVYKTKLNWTEDEKTENETWMTGASALGLMIGSLLASTIVRMGRRKAILLGSVI